MKHPPKKPVVTVIMPAYNVAATIQKSIKSVLEQSLERFELLVIDDGSTDETTEIVRAYDDERVKLIHVRHGGSARARNEGIGRAKGEFVAFLDADDLWTRDKLASSVDALRNDPTAAVAYGWTDRIDEQDRFYKQGSHWSYQGDVYRDSLIMNFLESGSNIVAKKSAFEVVGLYDESFLREDWEMAVRLAKRFKFVVIPRVQVLYRMRMRVSVEALSVTEKMDVNGICRIFEDAPSEFQYLKRVALASRYDMLTWKSIELHVGNTGYYFRQMLRYTPVPLWPFAACKTMLKTIIIVLFPGTLMYALCIEVNKILKW